MNQEQDNVNAIRRRVLCICAVVVPITSLMARSVLVDSTQSPFFDWSDYWLAAPAPFGLSRVLCVYVLCCVPFSLWLTGLVTRSLPRNAGVFFLFLGAALCTSAAAMLVSLPVGSESGVWQRNLFRIAWTLLLQLPWFLAAMQIEVNERSSQSNLLSGFLAFMIAFLAPAFYSESVINRQLQLFELHQKNGHLVDALHVVKRLNQLGAKPMLDDSRIAELDSNQVNPNYSVRSGLREIEDQLQQMVDSRANFLKRPLPAQPSYGQLVARVQILISLGAKHFDDAASLLTTSGLANNDSLGASMLGNIKYWQKDFNQASEQFRTTIRLESEKAQPDKQLVNKAYNNLADSLRASEGNLAAEQMYLDALASQADEDGTLRFGLATHYQLSGRPVDALQQFEQIESLEGPLALSAQQRIEQIRSESAGCLLWR